MFIVHYQSRAKLWLRRCGSTDPAMFFVTAFHYLDQLVFYNYSTGPLVSFLPVQVHWTLAVPCYSSHRTRLNCMVRISLLTKTSGLGWWVLMALQDCGVCLTIQTTFLYTSSLSIRPNVIPRPPQVRERMGGGGGGARGKGQGARGKGQGARGKGQGARGKGQGARGKGQGAREEGDSTHGQIVAGPHPGPGFSKPD